MTHSIWRGLILTTVFKFEAFKRKKTISCFVNRKNQVLKTKTRLGSGTSFSRKNYFLKLAFQKTLRRILFRLGIDCWPFQSLLTSKKFRQLKRLICNVKECKSIQKQTQNFSLAPLAAAVCVRISAWVQLHNLINKGHFWRKKTCFSQTPIKSNLGFPKDVLYLVLAL